MSPATKRNVKNLGKRIDHLFGAQKEWERIIQIQSESLQNIAEYAERLKEVISQTGPARPLLEKICVEAKKRI